MDIGLEINWQRNANRHWDGAVQVQNTAWRIDTQGTGAECAAREADLQADFQAAGRCASPFFGILHRISCYMCSIPVAGFPVKSPQSKTITFITDQKMINHGLQTLILNPEDYQSEVVPKTMPTCKALWV
jgi:hypothetical protein